MRLKRILVTGAGGFIGSHLVEELRNDSDCVVIGADLKKPEYDTVPANKFFLVDLRNWENCLAVTKGVDQVYALAADMGGMGFITTHQSEVLFNNAMISFQTIEAARQNGVEEYLYTSSACVYPEFLQEDVAILPLREDDAYPAQPDTEYGWEKLVTERLVDQYRKDHGMNTHIVRFHNIFGPRGTWVGGREKAPAALCRKIAVAKLTGNPTVEIWGDGEQTRSFCYIDDCVRGIHMLMNSSVHEPINLGQDRMIAINDLAYLIAKIADAHIELKHITGPQGVRGRNSDNTKITEELQWQPRVSLEDGLLETYAWIENQVAESLLRNPERAEMLARSVTYQ